MVSWNKLTLVSKKNVQQHLCTAIANTIQQGKQSPSKFRVRESKVLIPEVMLRNTIKGSKPEAKRPFRTKISCKISIGQLKHVRDQKWPHPCPPHSLFFKMEWTTVVWSFCADSIADLVRAHGWYHNGWYHKLAVSFFLGVFFFKP
jgi:hypothetical protein